MKKKGKKRRAIKKPNRKRGKAIKIETQKRPKGANKKKKN
jgi:hypothetical protein